MSRSRGELEGKFAPLRKTRRGDPLMLLEGARQKAGRWGKVQWLECAGFRGLGNVAIEKLSSSIGSSGNRGNHSAHVCGLWLNRGALAVGIRICFRAPQKKVVHTGESTMEPVTWTPNAEQRKWYSGNSPGRRGLCAIACAARATSQFPFPFRASNKV